MTFLKSDDVIKNVTRLDNYFSVFERSYAVPNSCKVSYLWLVWFRIYDGGWPPPPLHVLFHVKKAQTR